MEEEKIIRLKRPELHSAEYKKFIEPLFAGKEIEKRIRYSQWAFADNPFLTEGEDLPIYLFQRDGKNLGHIAYIPIEVVLQGKIIQGGWCVDFFSDPNAQRKGLGKKLMETAYRDFPVMLSLGQTDMAYYFLLKFGWQYSGNATEYQIFSWKALKKYILKKLGVKAGPTMNLTLSKTFQCAQNVVFEAITSVSQMDFSGCQHENSHFSYIPRTSRFFEWRFFQHPFISYNVHHIYSKDEFDVYIVWRIMNNELGPRAMVVDVIYKSQTSLSGLKKALKIMIEYTLSQGIEILECQTTDTSVLEALPKTIFSKRQQGKRFLYKAQEGIGSTSLSVRDWKLFSSDCDLESLTY